MARSLSLSQTLTRLALSRRSLLSSTSLHYTTIRHRSDQPTAEAALESDTTPDAATAIEPSLALRQLDDAIQLIVVKRSAPDWLPFVPGSSYWVPPPRRPPSQAIVDILSKLENALNKDETMSLTTSRGWPSSAYFIDGAIPYPVGLGIPSHNTSDSEDEG